MGARGKPSSAELATTPIPLAGRKAPPPAELGEREAAVWRNVVATLPADWFARHHHPMLIAYCRHTVRANDLAQKIEKFDDAWLKIEGGLGRFDKLLQMAARETSSMLACARSMRITHQAQIQPRTAARRMDGGGRPRPWDTDVVLGADPMFDDYEPELGDDE